MYDNLSLKPHHVSSIDFEIRMSGLGALINLECKMHGHGFGFPLKSSFTRIGMASNVRSIRCINILGNALLLLRVDVVVLINMEV